MLQITMQSTHQLLPTNVHALVLVCLYMYIAVCATVGDQVVVPIHVLSVHLVLDVTTSKQARFVSVPMEGITRMQFNAI